MDTALTETEEQKALEILGNNRTALVRSSSWIFWDYLTAHVLYTGVQVTVERITVDEIDNIHIARR